MKRNKENCSKDNIMPIPQLRAIKELILHSDEIFIAAGGFEDRILECPQIVEPDKTAGNKAILLDYRPSENENRLGDLKEMLTEKRIDVSPIIYDRHKPENFDDTLKVLLLKSSVKSVCLDISGMSRLAIMIVIDVIRELNLSLRIVYAEALHYAPSETDFEKAKATGKQHLPTSFIHTGVYDVLHIDRLSSIRMQNHATLLIAFDSFNEALCQALVNSINPSNLILINGRPPRKELKWREEATKYVHHCLRKEWSVGDVDKPTETTSTLYYNETYELLVRLYWEFSSSHRIILAPTGSKMQAIGCYLLRAVHNDVHIEYPVVQGFFANKYSTDVRETWQLDFGEMDNFVKLLRRKEIKEYLNLPEEFVNANID